MSLVDYAKKELELARDKNGHDEALEEAVLELIELFHEQGHSGNSAGMTISLFRRLLDFKPLKNIDELTDHGKKKLDLLGLLGEDSDYGGMLGEALIELIQLFSKQGHSGKTALKTIELFCKLADFKPITQLTLAEDEWNEVRENSYQNKRNSAVFKDAINGKPYYIYAYTKRTQNNTCWVGSLQLRDGRTMGRCYIKDTANMPTVVLNVIEKEVAKDDWEMTLEDESQLEELAKYYEFSFSEQT